MKRKLTVLVCLLLIFSMSVQQVRAAEADEYVQQLIGYYRHYQQEAEGDIRRVLEELGEKNPEEAERWTGIMNRWRWINEEMELHTGVLPDGLAEDDSLCIVVLGFRLESSGAMQPELIRRLEAALASARKYPNATVVCTGGATSQRSDITEAGEMKKWLIASGVEQERILTETRAANTPQNAVYVYELLQRSRPQVSRIALITSDYHIYRSMTLFSAEAMLKDLPYSVDANAVCATEMAGEKELGKQANNLAELAGIRLSEDFVPELRVIATEPSTAAAEETLPAETVQPAEPETTAPREVTAETLPLPEPETKAKEIPVFAVAAFAGALILALILLILLIRISRPRRK